MGTNYYCRIIPIKERRDELCNLIQTSMDFSEINRFVKEMYGLPDFPDYETETVKAGEIHLGKSSWGWKFLWNPNIYEIRQGHMEYDNDDIEHFHGRYVEDPSKAFKFYELTQKGLKEFIFRDDVLVYDEYGDIQDKKEFWESALSRKGVDAVSYYKQEKKKDKNYHEYSCYNDYVKFLESLGYKSEFPYHDFYSDGLRFATCTDFC